MDIQLFNISLHVHVVIMLRLAAIHFHLSPGIAPTIAISHASMSFLKQYMTDFVMFSFAGVTTHDQPPLSSLITLETGTDKLSIYST